MLTMSQSKVEGCKAYYVYQRRITAAKAFAFELSQQISEHFVNEALDLLKMERIRHLIGFANNKSFHTFKPR